MLCRNCGGEIVEKQMRNGKRAYVHVFYRDAVACGRPEPVE
jgi:hypothetical protein